MTVLEWVTQRRMAEVRGRLRETDEDVGIVAERVGYLDPVYFARLFRREHGVSARAFRRQASEPGSERAPATARAARPAVTGD
jgi:AraC family transcriptional regulator, transcriptional activator of pobA